VISGAKITFCRLILLNADRIKTRNHGLGITVFLTKTGYQLDQKATKCHNVWLKSFCIEVLC